MALDHAWYVLCNFLLLLLLLLHHTHAYMRVHHSFMIVLMSRQMACFEVHPKC